MQKKTSGYLAALCLVLIFWLYYNVGSTHIDYNWHNFLVNSTSGERSQPRDVLDLSKIIKPPTEDFLNKTTPIDRLFHLSQRTNYVRGLTQHVYSDAGQLEQSGWPVADKMACGRQLAWIQRQLATHKHYSQLNGRLGEELTKLMDSFGKPEAGIYLGAITWPGQYDACKLVSLDAGQIRTRYCLAMMRLKSWPSKELGLPKTRIRVGICLPETCDSSAVEVQNDKIDSLIKFDLSTFLRENLALESIYCLPDERSPLRKLPTGGWIYIGLISGWLALVAIASVVLYIVSNSQEKSSNKEQLSMLSNGKPLVTTRRARPAVWLGLLKILSLQQSWAAFTSNPISAKRRAATVSGSASNDEKTRVNLSSINIIKCLSALAFVYAHAYIIVSFYATSIDHDVKLMLSRIFYFSANINKLVDVFFMLFGLLASYGNLRKLGPETLSSLRHWIFYNCYTLIKIGAVYVLLYWYAKLVEPYTGEGPWWDYGTYRYSLRGNCIQEPWWRSIPYFSDLGARPRTTCSTVGWFVVSLAQIALFVPPIIYLLYKLPNHLYRCLLMAFLTGISSLQMIMKMLRQTSIRGEAFGSYGGFLITLLEQFEDTGTLSSLGRLSSVAYGCYFGYLLHLYEICAISEWPRWLTSKLALTLTIFGNLLIVFIPFIGKLIMDSTHYVTSVGDFLITYLVTMIIWPLLNGLLVLLAATVYKKAPLVQALGHPFWHTANKLVFGLYLVHWPVIMYLVTGFQHGPSMGTWLDVFKLTSLGFVISLLLTFPIKILIDIPLTTLLTLIVHKIEMCLEGPARDSKSALASNTKVQN